MAGPGPSPAGSVRGDRAVREAVVHAAHQAFAEAAGLPQGVLEGGEGTEAFAVAALLLQRQAGQLQAADVEPGRGGGVAAGLAAVGGGAQEPGDEPGVERGRVGAQQGQVAAACERYRDLAERSGRDDIRRSLGRCHARLARDAYEAGRPAEAIGRYRQAVDASPEREHWNGLALAHARAGEVARGQVVLEQALRAFPDDPELLADMVLAAANEALRSAHEVVESKLKAQLPDLGGLGLPGL